MTKTKRAIAAHTSRSDRSRSPQPLRGPAGRKPGLIKPIAAMVSMYIETASRPGRMPAMNSLPMSCWVMRP